MFNRITENEDIKEVALLAKEIWNQHYTPVIGKKQVDYMIDLLQSEKAIKEQISNENYQYYFINIDNKNIGYIAVVPEEDKLFLSKLYIKSINRGRGVGKKSIEFVKNIAKELKLNKIALTVNKYNTNSILFYENQGFKRVSSIVFDLGNGFFMDDHQMELKL